MNKGKMKTQQKINKQKGLISIALILIIGLTLGLNASAAASPTALIVNYDMTKMDKDLKPGGSGTLIIVIQNTGGLPAKDVTASISYPPAGISASVKSNLGTINPGASVTVRTFVTVSDTLKPDTYLLSLKLDYTSESCSDPSCTSVKEEDVSPEWQIPINIYGNPNFQISVDKTEFYKDTVSELIITGVAQGEIRNLDAELKSNCLEVVGSKKKYLGDLNANKNFILNYTVKPSTVGMCNVDVSMNYLDNYGKSMSETAGIGLSIRAPNVDLRVLSVDFGAPSPGGVINLKIKIKNIGKDPAESLTAVLDLSAPFVPVDTTELYIGNVDGGETVDANFNVAVSYDAVITAYSLPLILNYEVDGTPYSVKKEIGIDVTGQITLQVINVASSSGSLRVDVVNLGTRSADGVKATLVTGGTSGIASDAGGQAAGRQGGANFTAGSGGGRRGMLNGSGDANYSQFGQQRSANQSNQSGQSQYFVSYKSNIKPSTQTTFTFSTQLSGTATLILEYTGLNNQRVTQTERISAGSSGTSAGMGGGGRNSQSGTSTTTYLLYGIIILVVLWGVYRKYKHENILPEFIAKKLKR